MCDDIFERCQTDYESISNLVKAVSRAVAGEYACSEILEELISECWILALEMMAVYNPERGCKVSSFLWQQLNWRLRRYYLALKRRNDSDSLSGVMNVKLSTDCITHSNIYEGNPYIMSPDTVYEKSERIQLWSKIKEEYASRVELCLSVSPRNADSIMRTRLSRIKQRELTKLRISLQKMFL